MKESLRRVILFAVTVVTGSVMILFDIPPLLMVPLLIIVGIAILIGLGAITVADLREIIARKKTVPSKTVPPKTGSPPKISIVQRLNEMKFFEKKEVATPQNASPKSPSKPLKKPEKPVPLAKAETTSGILTHIKTFVSSLGSLGTVLKERSKQGKKVEDINKLLDKTVSEKVSGSALASAGNVSGGARPQAVGGPGAGPVNPQAEEDPFLSLSGDEFDAGLLDGLDDGEPAGGIISGPAKNSGNLVSPDAMENEPAIPTPSMDFSQEADEILKGNAPGPEEFDGLIGEDTIDDDFGNLGDLGDLNLDDVNLDEEHEPDAPKQGENTGETPVENKSMPTGPAVKEIKTDWIKSDAPQGEDQVSTQADMAAFAGSKGTDEDLLSSIASDVKHTKKSKDVSLLRDLKDFKAPAEEIEQELHLVSERIHAIPRPDKNAQPPAKEIK